MIALLDTDIHLYLIGYSTEDVDEDIAFARLDEHIAGILETVEADSYKCFLSDSKENNFRYKIDPTYKGNRTQPKPRHYEALKEYLIVKHKAVICHGHEADDFLGIEQTKGQDQGYETIICSLDKDLNQITGLHYSWPIWRHGEIIKQGVIFDVDPLQALQSFYRQLLTGDVSDNIKGIDKLGPVKASKLIDFQEDEYNMFIEVANKYMNQYGDDWEEHFDKNARLLYIKRYEEKEYQRPTCSATWDDEW